MEHVAEVVGSAWLQRQRVRNIVLWRVGVFRDVETLLQSAAGVLEWCEGPYIEAIIQDGRRTPTRVGGRRVVPGLMDSHTHVIRGGLNYNMELRWDGVPSLAEALRMLK